MAKKETNPENTATEPEKPKLSEALLRATLATIEERNSDLSRPALIEELRAIEGVAFEEVEAGIWNITLHGLIAEGLRSDAEALRIWCQKARRAILNGEAV